MKLRVIYIILVMCIFKFEVMLVENYDDLMDVTEDVRSLINQH